MVRSRHLPNHLTFALLFLQFVPLVVELCIDIVEAKGLENQGIYRVPGNTGSVNFLQELLNNATVSHRCMTHASMHSLFVHTTQTHKAEESHAYFAFQEPFVLLCFDCLLCSLMYVEF